MGYVGVVADEYESESSSDEESELDELELRAQSRIASVHCIFDQILCPVHALPVEMTGFFKLLLPLLYTGNRWRWRT